MGQERARATRSGSRSAARGLGWGAGLAASALTAPLLAYLAASDPGAWPLLVCLSVVTGILGARLSSLLARRRLRTRAAGTEPDREEGLEDDLEDLVERQLTRERDLIISVIASLISALEARDPCTRDHSSKVAHLAVRLGREMGLPPEHLYEIHLGGLLHDVGKIGIPDAILRKPAGLTRAEYEIMKTHAELGARILAGVPGLEAVSDIILCHHEMYDGGGYPAGMAGEDIPLGSRIIAVSDTYLSLTESRPYRRGQPFGKAMKEIRRVAGRQLDPGVVDALERVLEHDRRVIQGAFPRSEPEPLEAERLAS